MPAWMKKLFIEILPKILMIERPIEIKISYYGNGLIREINDDNEEKSLLKKKLGNQPLKQMKKAFPKSIVTALKGLEYISSQMVKENIEQKV
jgi:hypothetical protein